MDKFAQTRLRDARVEREALAGGLCARAEIEQCLELQRRIEELGVAVDLLHLLEDQGFLRPADAERLARLAPRGDESETMAGAALNAPVPADGGAETRARHDATGSHADDTLAGATGESPDGGVRRPNDPTILETSPGKAVVVPARAGEAPGRVGDYRILREVGRGGMGVVYEAIQEPLQRRVAVKVLLSIGEDTAKVERFRREASAAARLSHPGIVRVYGAGESGGAYFYAMEFVEGKSLAALAGERRFAPHEAARLVIEAADALHYAHENGLVHRDIKPANLMLDPTGRVLITDFGLVRDEQQGSLTGSGQILGTPRYMSPEQADGRNDSIDRRSDVYSLGACLYELLSGKPIFEGDSVALLLRRVLFEDPLPLRRHVPALAVDLETICMKSVSKEPERRYDTALELKQDLERYLAGDPILARPMGPVSRVVRRVRRHPVAAGAWLAAFLVASAGLGFAWAARVAERAHSGVLNRASSLFAQGKPDQAIAAVDELLQTAPRYPPAHLARARMLHRLGRRDEAIADYDRALTLDPRRWEAALERGHVRASRGEWDAALEDTRLALRLDAGEPSIAISLALLLAEAGDPEAADRALAGLPDDLTPDLARATAAARGAVLLARGLAAEARDTCRDARRRFGNDARLLEVLGRAELACGDPAAALEPLVEAHALDPHDPRPRVALAQARLERLDFDDALADLEAAAAEAPGWHRPWIVRAAIAPPKPALEYARKARTLAPGDPDARLLLARTLARTAAWEEAESVARAPQGEDCPPELTCVRAQALLAQGRANESRDLLDRLLAAAPDHPEALARRGAARRASGDREGARADFAAALARRDRSPRAALRAIERAEALFLLHNRKGEVVDRTPRLDSLDSASRYCVQALLIQPTDGQTLARLGDALFDRCLWRDALTAYREALAANPLVLDAWLGAGFLLVEVPDLRDPRAARALLDEGLQWLPGAARLHDLSGLLHARERADAEALADFDRAISLDPDLPPAWRHRAVLQRRQGRRDAEAQDLARGRAAPPDPLRHSRLINTAYHARRLEQPTLAHLLASRAIDEHPRSGAAYEQRAEAAIDMRRYEQGMLDYMRALELDARLGVKIHCNSLRLMAKFPMGIQFLMQQILALAERLDEEPAFHFLRAYVELMAKGNVEEAEARLKRALEMNPDFTLAYTLLGGLRFDQGNFEEAGRLLEDSLRREPEAGLTHYYLACYHALRGDKSRAVDHVESALRLGFQDFRDVVAKEPRLTGLQGDPRFDEWTRQR